MKVVIIKYNAGNIRSVLFALERIGVTAIVTDDHEEIRSADRVIFPGVGEASSAMKYLAERGLDKLICSLTQPVLGICLGMQLMCSSSEEGDAECLNIFPNKVIKLRGKGIKIPHMGWNSVANTRSPLFTGIEERAYFYFVHSFAPVCNEFTAATTEYGDIFSSALSKNNFYGTQFHPEKSGETGEILLRNFMKIKD